MRKIFEVNRFVLIKMNFIIFIFRMIFIVNRIRRVFHCRIWIHEFLNWSYGLASTCMNKEQPSQSRLSILGEKGAEWVLNLCGATDLTLNTNLMSECYSTWFYQEWTIFIYLQCRLIIIIIKLVQFQKFFMVGKIPTQ